MKINRDMIIVKLLYNNMMLFKLLITGNEVSSFNVASDTFKQKLLLVINYLLQYRIDG